MVISEWYFLGSCISTNTLTLGNVLTGFPLASVGVLFAWLTSGTQVASTFKGFVADPLLLVYFDADKNVHLGTDRRWIECAWVNVTSYRTFRVNKEILHGQVASRV